MKKIFLNLGVAFTLGTSAFAQNTNWALDKSHSSINFEVAHMVISETSGKFEDFTVNVKSDKEDFTDAVFDFTAKVSSINTADPKRDAHLQGTDFFNAEKYPDITFKGKRFTKIKGTEYEVQGDLTMHGKTVPVTLKAKFNGTVKDPWGGTRAGIKVYGDIDRYLFDLKYNSALEAGGVMIGQMVHINCNIELMKK